MFDPLHREGLDRRRDPVGGPTVIGNSGRAIDRPTSIGEPCQDLR